MPPLADLQQRFVQAVMSGEAPAGLFAGAVPPAEALAVHRDTIMGALVNALRISYPTVDALVGEEFFDRTCRVFAKINPPPTASLSGYGEGFADFLTGFEPAAVLAYLPDVARLDWAVETTLRKAMLTRDFVLDAMVSIALPQNLVVLRLMYPADEIRAALGDDAALAGIIAAPAERFILLWRKGFDAAVLRVDAAAGRFLTSLLAGAGAVAAFDAALAGASETGAMRAIQADIFAASFCTVISTP
jgi:hypothetical protein